MPTNPKNKIKYNLRNVHIAKATVDADGVFTYGTPVAMPGAVSMSLSAEGETNPFYADGLVYYRSVANNGYEGDLEMALIPDWFRQDILQESLDTNNVLVEFADITEAVYFAMLFEFDGDKHKVRHVLYACQASRPEVAAQTKEASITPNTETLHITADPRMNDNLVKARTTADTGATAYNGWYSAVYEPVTQTQGG